VLVSFPSNKIGHRARTWVVSSPVHILVIRRWATPEPSYFLIHFDKRVKGFGIGVSYIKERSYRSSHKSVLYCLFILGFISRVPPNPIETRSHSPVGAVFPSGLLGSSPLCMRPPRCAWFDSGSTYQTDFDTLYGFSLFHSH